MANIIEDEIVKSVMQDGIEQVSENLVIDGFECAFEKDNRKLRVHFAAKNKESGEKTEINLVY